MTHCETVLHHFLMNAECFPNREAVSDSASSLTYGELDRRSDAVASFLREQGWAREILFP
ncbi:hypothetical protein A8U91_00419 [Halomonas elongata]|uniref:Uncharacterized protein n=1 Tax=Halomonas elongata TaxID=2746 RepID=A0A1B8P1K9_HALEL|nr:hypothetical protein A8U91_00419 [Halomonas elongata]